MLGTKQIEDGQHSKVTLEQTKITIIQSVVHTVYCAEIWHGCNITVSTSTVTN